MFERRHKKLKKVTETKQIKCQNIKLVKKSRMKKDFIFYFYLNIINVNFFLFFKS